MRVTAAVLLASLTTTALFGQSKPNSVSFDNETGNRILDSLKSRGDWLRAYQIRTSQLALEQDRHRDTEALRRQDSLKCDSIHWAGEKEKGTLIQENDELRDNAKRVPIIVTLATLIGLLAGLVLGQ